MSRVALLALLGALAACDPTVIKLTCRPLMAQELNEPEVCLGPPVTPDDLKACPTTAFPTGQVVTVCVVGPDDRIYSVVIAPSDTIKGDGWTHSAYALTESTLTGADIARCAKVVPNPGGVSFDAGVATDAGDASDAADGSDAGVPADAGPPPACP